MEQARITTQQPSQGHQAVRGKQASQSRDPSGQAQDSANGGFLSLLAALGDNVSLDGTMLQDGSLVPDEKGAVATDGAGQNGAIAWPWMSAQALMPVDANAASRLPLAPSAGSPLSSTEALQDGVLGGASGFRATSALGSLGSLETLPQNGLVAQTALLDSAVKSREGELESDGMDALQAAVAGGVRRAPSRASGGLVSVSGLSAMTGAQGAQALKSLGGAKDPNVMQAVQAAAGQSSAAEHRGGAAQSREGVRFMDQDPTTSLAPPTTFVPGFSEAGGRFTQHNGDQNGSATPGFGAPGANAESQGAPSADIAVVDTGMAGAEDAVAEQVAFWVHQNIQNAEMTIQHDGQPVEVSVSLSGNEAHVAFGSDQAETRSLLDDSVAQLREMLRQEGLSLSGVTVGESGQRQASEESGRNNQQGGPRQTVVEVSAAPQTQLSPKAGYQTDRSIDIFV